MVDFQAYKRPLDMVTVFKYLGWVLTACSDGFPGLIVNIWKSQSRRAPFYRILGWEGAYPKTSGTFYNVIIQTTLLFVSETFSMTHMIRTTLGEFHHRVDQCLA